MARKRRGGGRRSGKGITVNKAIVAAPALLGIVAYGKQALESYKADKDILHATTGIVARASGVSYDKGWAQAALVPLVGGTIGSKVLAKVATKEPAAVKRMLNARVL